MSKEERVHWDTHYRQINTTEPYPAPDPLLFEYVPPLFERRVYRALDVACGRGQNALWMAGQGYHVDAIDISRVALSAAQERATRTGVKALSLIPSDLDEAEIEQEAYDVVVVVRFIKRGLIPAIRAAVRPGGRIIYQNPNTHYLHVDPDHDPEQLFRIGELIGYFADWNVLHRSTDNRISQIVAVKPSHDA
jgi:tellurite methyltransferase